jgi:hypothetical protein
LSCSFEMGQHESKSGLDVLLFSTCCFARGLAPVSSLLTAQIMFDARRRDTSPTMAMTRELLQETIITYPTERGCGWTAFVCRCGDYAK